jgi:hypothetical protein
VIRTLSILFAIVTVASCQSEQAPESGDCPKGVNIAPGDCFNLLGGGGGVSISNDDAGADDAGEGGPR